MSLSPAIAETRIGCRSINHASVYLTYLEANSFAQELPETVSVAIINGMRRDMDKGAGMISRTHGCLIQITERAMARA